MAQIRSWEGREGAPASYSASSDGFMAGEACSPPELAFLALETTVFDGEDIGAYKNFMRTHL